MSPLVKHKSQHYMQSTEWAHLRPEYGWGVLKPKLGNKQVFAYTKKTPAGNLVYLPGYYPDTQQELTQLINQLQGQNNLVCKIEACAPLDAQIIQWFKDSGWKPAHSIQYEHTIQIDLTLPIENIWSNMKARGRQEVKYARKAKVKVEFVEPNEKNLDIMHDLLQETSRRKAFGIRIKQNVVHFWSSFAGAGHLKLALAKSGNQIIAGAVFITDGKNKVWYKDAGSKPDQNKLFGPRLILWKAIEHFKNEGYETLDLGGIPSPDNYENSAMKGVYVFKTAFTRDTTTMMPAYELPLKPVLYPLWKKIEPSALKTRRTLSKLKGKLN